jgi:integrase
MPKLAKEMTAIEVHRLTRAGFHSVGHISGLSLRVKPSGARSWILRATVGDLRRDIGLGPYPEVTLAQAREKAREARETIRQGSDPVRERQALVSARRAEQAKQVTFEEAAAMCIAKDAPGWRNAKHAQQWRNTLATYAYPVVGSMLVRDVAPAHVLKILEPIWLTKTETARRLRSRIEAVLDFATGRGYRTGDNPAKWKGNLSAQLTAPQKIAKTTHHAALSVAEMGAFMGRLRAIEGMGARALEFAILTAARSGEARNATWSEIDLESKVWTVPAGRMKAGREHRVPLSDAVLDLLRALPRLTDTDIVFPASRGGPLSDMTLTAVLRRMGVNAVPHGFRSTFRDWAAEHTNYPREAAEMALAHAIGDKVEAAYRRGDLFGKRRRMMTDWACYCARPLAGRSEVVALNRRA